MNFDFSWFLTLPGMLITGGILLLIVAVIILIVTSRKSKKIKNPVQENETNPVTSTTQVAPPMNMNNGSIMANPTVPTETLNSTPMPGPMPNNNFQPMTNPSPVIPNSMPMENMAINPPVNNEMNTIPTSPTQTITPPIEVMTPSGIAPSIPENNQAIANSPMVSTPTLEPVPTMEQPISTSQIIAEPTINPTPIMEQPSMGEPNLTPITPDPIPSIPEIPTVEATPPTIEAIPSIAPNEPNISAPVMQPTNNISQNQVVQSSPTIEPGPVQQQPVIYGGASPIVPNINVAQEESHQIYGGANPLENTQTIPTINTRPEPTAQPVPTIVSPQTQPVQQVEAIPTSGNV